MGCMLVQATDRRSRTVVIDQGPVVGYKDPEGGLYVYYNIPYATAPTGKDRYKAPLPPPSWVSPFKAIDRGIICPQMDVRAHGRSYIEHLHMQEDCLVANIYVPETDAKNLPVVVVIHGGCYLLSLGDTLNYKQMGRKNNFIYVNFNYRLGAHGFLCLGTPDVPGNAGMKDIVALLRWVKRNIASFGGNPEDVTVEGHNSGSSAIDLMLLSKSAKGLFRRVIPESGAGVAMWSVQIDPIANAKHFAKYELGFNNVDDFYALEDFYKTVSYDVMFNKDGISLVNKHINNFMFTPCVERDTGSEMFLDDSPISILKKGDFNKVPALYGFTDLEGLFRVDNGYKEFVAGMNSKFSDYLPHDLQFKDEQEKEKVANFVKKFYFGNAIIGHETIREYINFYTDTMFAYPMIRALRLQVEAGNYQMYLYQFSYQFPFSIDNPNVPELVPIKINGSRHSVQALTVADDLRNDFDDDDVFDFEQIVNVTRQFWTNFIKTSNPVPPGSKLPAWPAAGKSGSPHMEITEHPQLLGEPLKERTRFWDAIYGRYYRAPSPPPTPPPRPRTEL
ncbi:carboxylesterase family domain-containing protein [Phthorimaea operculella]|nr:carboxylesterase family domain-containing protein [Phthorimaea operculella]